MQSLLGSIIICVFLSGCKVEFMPDLDETYRVDEPAFWAGVVSGPAIHEFSHYAVLEAKNIEYDFSGTSFKYRAENETDKRAVSRAGFVGQISTALLLDSLPENKINQDFLAGLKLSNAMHVGSYSMRRGSTGGDLKYISDFEYAAYASLSIGMNFIKITW